MREFEFISDKGLIIRGKYLTFPLDSKVKNRSTLDIVLIHAFPFDSIMFYENFKDESFLQNLNNLAAKWGNMRIFIPDLPGFGLSEAFSSRPKNLNPYVEVIYELVRKFSLQRMIMGGCSMGGYIALEYTHQHPINLEGLILMDTKPTADTDQQKKDRVSEINKFVKIREDFKNLKDQSIKINELYSSIPEIQHFIDDLHSNLLAQDLPQKEPKMSEKILSLMKKQSLKGVIHALSGMAGRKDNTQTLKDFMGKILLIVGEKDKITPVEIFHEMEKMIKFSELIIISDAGHLSNIEQTKEFNDKLFDWLRKIMT